MRRPKEEVAVPERAGRFWPKSEPLPMYYVKHRMLPLPCRNMKCRRITLDTGQRAVVCMHSGRDIGWFHCKACGHTFKMPVKLI
jgi:hypothetical protein